MLRWKTLALRHTVSKDLKKKTNIIYLINKLSCYRTTSSVINPSVFSAHANVKIISEIRIRVNVTKQQMTGIFSR